MPYSLTSAGKEIVLEDLLDLLGNGRETTKFDIWQLEIQRMLVDFRSLWLEVISRCELSRTSFNPNYFMLWRMCWTFLSWLGVVFFKSLILCKYWPQCLKETGWNLVKGQVRKSWFIFIVQLGVMGSWNWHLYLSISSFLWAVVSA